MWKSYPYKTLGFFLFFHQNLKSLVFLKGVRPTKVMLEPFSFQHTTGSPTAMYLCQQRKLTWLQKHTDYLLQLESAVHLSSGSMSHLIRKWFCLLQKQSLKFKQWYSALGLIKAEEKKNWLLSFYVPQRKKNSILLFLYKTCCYIYISLLALMYFIPLI